MDPELERLHISPPPDVRTREIRSSLDGPSVETKEILKRMPPELLGELFILCRNNSLESDESYPRSILNTREAPMVLGHVSSYWRTISLGTPALWDFVSLIMNSIVAGPTIPFIRTLLERSRTLPLTITVANRRPMVPTALNVNAPFLRFLWDFHDRLQHIHLDISSSDLVPQLFPLQISLPVLMSLSIDITSEVDTEPTDLPALLGLFQHAPSLHVLKLNASYIPAILISGFPWHQLTSFTSQMCMEIAEVHRLLRTCLSLKTFQLRYVAPSTVDNQPLSPCILRGLRLLELGATSEGVSLPGIFDSLSFPALETLDLTFTVSMRSLIQLHARSQFDLQHLELATVYATAQEIIQFLRLLPTLKTLGLDCCSADATDANLIFQAFTHLNNSWSLPLRLPQLQKLMLADYSGELDESVVSAFAESLLQYPGTHNTSFSCLESVRLYMLGPKFMPLEFASRISSGVIKRIILSTFFVLTLLAIS
ncbi:hypothetical protein B0H13DRAFT_2528810 [Mycena leptocephala]|nr:hypothetical protein B0H13DRAFT_2528810 [Mycena leptocephala]